MPFRVRCPRCGQTAEIAEEHLGKQGQCNGCGLVVSIPARLNKVCFVCAADITQLPHTKDEHSNYLCMSCYESRNGGSSTAAASARLECSICHVHFPREQAAGPSPDPVCPDCATILQARQLPVAIPVAPEASTRTRPLPRPPIPPMQATSARVAPAASRLPLVLASIALAGTVILAILHFTPRPNPAPNPQPAQADPDQQTLTRILILKAQAQVLIDVGKLREGIEKYDQALRISSSNPTIAAELDAAKAEREKALKVLAATVPPPASDEKTVSTPEPQKSASKLFNE